MARLRTNILHWGNKYDGPDTYKDGRRGALDDAFWNEDEPVDYRSKPSKKKRKRAAGCPENNNKNHVYVWDKVTRHWTGFFDNRKHEHTYWVKTCCGCGHVYTGRGRNRYSDPN